MIAPGHEFAQHIAADEVVGEVQVEALDGREVGHAADAAGLEEGGEVRAGDELAVFGRVLVADEVRRMYEEGKP